LGEKRSQKAPKLVARSRPRRLLFMSVTSWSSSLRPPKTSSATKFPFTYLNPKPPTPTYETTTTAPLRTQTLLESPRQSASPIPCLATLLATPTAGDHSSAASTYSSQILTILCPRPENPSQHCMRLDDTPSNLAPSIHFYQHLQSPRQTPTSQVS
jgi:hypothetical protein